MTPHDKITALQERFPEMKLTVGYIGNCGVDSRGRFDDRSWRVFTNLTYSDGHSVSVYIDGPDFDLDKVVSELGRIRGDRFERPWRYRS